MKVGISLIMASALTLGSTLALADDRDHNRHDQRGNARQASRFDHSRSQNHHDRSPNWSINLNLNSSPGAYNRPYNRPYSGYQNGYSGTSLFGWGNYTTIPGLGIVRTYPQAPVVIERNTYIYTSPSPYSDNYSSNSSRSYSRSSSRNSTTTYSQPASDAGVSLLRDRYGRCYERTLDRLGNETRIELPATACDF